MPSSTLGSVTKRDEVSPRTTSKLTSGLICPPSARTWIKKIKKRAVTLRDDLAENMTGEQLAEAQRLATEWEPKTWEVIRKELKIEVASIAAFSDRKANQ